MSQSSDEASDNNAPTALAQVMANILASSAAAKKGGKNILTKVNDNKSDREKALIRLKREARRKRQVAKLAWERMSLVKPSIADKDRERNLTKIATKGVVQLFNAVSTQQDRIRSKLAVEGTTDSKRTRIVNSLSRSSFIDLLKSQTQHGTVKNEKNDATDTKSKNKTLKKEGSQPKWKTLHEDFVMSEYASGIPADADDDEVKPEPR